MSELSDWSIILDNEFMILIRFNGLLWQTVNIFFVVFVFNSITSHPNSQPTA